MYGKFVVLSIFCARKPCQLKIIYDNCFMEKNINANMSKIRICTKNQFIKLIAKYENITYYKTIYLNNCKCQNNFANFMFNVSILQKIKFNIFLTDKNYGFPVSNAILNFKQLQN